MSAYTRQVLTIASEVPYSTLISEYLQLHFLSLSKFIDHSRHYERPYLAWEAVRKARNPFFIDGTGLEGYYVGQCLSPEEIAERLLQLGHFMLGSNCQLYRFNYRFKSHLMKTLLGEMSDPLSIEVWSAQFGAVLGRLRCNLLTNTQTRFFQTETYQSTSSLPAIRYTQGCLTIEQEYSVPRSASESISVWAQPLESALKPSDSDAYLVIQSIGKFGHPLIRRYLDERNELLDTSNS
ncbi:MAG TPA: hypothetical protein VHD90_18855 [Phototrophicaceae bacterium]|nr:hypothetical protein [Phototrophicaceae bacterium]